MEEYSNIKIETSNIHNRPYASNAISSIMQNSKYDQAK